MYVEAIRPGYYDLVRRKIGDQFRIKGAKDFSFVWMKPCNEADWEKIKIFEKNNPKIKRYKPNDFYYPGEEPAPINESEVLEEPELTSVEQVKLPKDPQRELRREIANKQEALIGADRKKKAAKRPSEKEVI